MKINNITKILLSLIIFTVTFITVSTHTKAACAEASYCDAAPGTCSTTANGGFSIVVGSFMEITRTCDIEVTKTCTPCNRDKDKYCEPECTLSNGCTTTSTEVINTSCVDTVWESCCTPGTPSSCGDGSCDTGAGESSASCPSDCGASTWCGDGSCNGGESSSSCSSDCPATVNPAATAAPVADNNNNNNNTTTSSCGDGSCSGSESCSNCSSDCGSCPYCGDGSCNGSDNCSNCAIDCGSCAGAFCGDTSCDAFETCDTCSRDCGACEENTAWFQISAGNVGSANIGESSVAIQSNITDTAECVAPACIRSLLKQDSANTTLTDGFAVVGSGTIDANGLITTQRSQNIYSSNTTKTRYQEKYEFFYRNSGLDSNPLSDFTGSEADALKPSFNSNDIVYFQSGNLTIQSQWSVASGETYVVFVDGDLTFTDGGNDQLIDVAQGGFLAFIVSGDIIVEESLGNSNFTDTTANLEGVYIADGSLTIASRGQAAGGDDRFVGEGVFVGWSGVNLNRDYSDGSNRSLENNDKPIELFVYRPDLLVNMPDIMLVPIRIWQETN